MRDMFEGKTVLLVKVDTLKNVADALTNVGLMDWGLCMLRHVYIRVVTLKGL